MTVADGPRPGARRYLLAPKPAPTEKEIAEAVADLQQFVTKDSGDRTQFDSGMVRDLQAGKPRYDLIPRPPLRRLADLYSRGAEKYGENNWQKANGPAELASFKASAFRHFMSWLEGELDEDHCSGAVWNMWAYEEIKTKLETLP